MNLVYCNPCLYGTIWYLLVAVVSVLQAEGYYKSNRKLQESDPLQNQANGIWLHTTKVSKISLLFLDITKALKGP